ncbi:hypothetical protein AZ18_4917, partial [Bordetella bronchiseptica D993]
MSAAANHVRVEDAGGVRAIDCEALDAAALAHRPRALFVNTVLQNPSGASLGMANAFRVLQAAERHGLW